MVFDFFLPSFQLPRARNTASWRRPRWIWNALVPKKRHGRRRMRRFPSPKLRNSKSRDRPTKRLHPSSNGKPSRHCLMKPNDVPIRRTVEDILRLHNTMVQRSTTRTNPHTRDCRSVRWLVDKWLSSIRFYSDHCVRFWFFFLSARALCGFIIVKTRPASRRALHNVRDDRRYVRG